MNRRSSNLLAGLTKRGVDVLAAGLALLLLSPLLAVAAAAIKLDTPGPVLYRGERTGRYGRRFRMLKLRSMYVGVRTEYKGFTTGQNDPRITPVGHRLRRWKIDELPQLWNVFVGQMSLVGPRPELPYYTDQYTEEEREILSVRPGITDYSSLRFHALQDEVGEGDADTVFETKVLPVKNQLRLQYARDHTLIGDMRVLLATVWLLARSVLRPNRRLTAAR